jgi:general secretion pathway protein D
VLDIEQEVSSKKGDQQVGQEGNTFPTFTTTKTKTSIVVPDKQGIVIGGIMDETKGESWQGIPLLSKIPVLGYLFRYNVDTLTKKELIIIVTPRVVSDRTEAEKLTVEYINKLRNVKKLLIEKEHQVDVPGLKDAESSELNGS